ncbi:MAG: hypothetical protein M1825_001626 [Sarcosagium campestre]|nr:MAG: hypothetical protein M1825_001626 [Sarcosagium campestre]
MQPPLDWRPPTPREEGEPFWSYLKHGVVHDYRRGGIRALFLPLPGKGSRRYLFRKHLDYRREKREEAQNRSSTRVPECEDSRPGRQQKPRHDRSRAASGPSLSRSRNDGQSQRNPTPSRFTEVIDEDRDAESSPQDVMARLSRRRRRRHDSRSRPQQQHPIRRVEHEDENNDDEELEQNEETVNPVVPSRRTSASQSRRTSTNDTPSANRPSSTVSPEANSDLLAPVPVRPLLICGKELDDPRWLDGSRTRRMASGGSKRVRVSRHSEKQRAKQVVTNYDSDGRPSTVTEEDSE